MNQRSTLLPSAVEAIGDTPLVELSRITRNVDGRILAKLDHLNPGFSKRDRIARQIIEDAEADGTLSPGQTVVELTSGNTGTGLSRLDPRTDGSVVCFVAWEMNIIFFFF